MKTKYLLFIFFVIFSLNAKAQVEHFKNDEYVKNGDYYEMLDVNSLEHFRIVDNTLTIKFHSNTTISEIENFQNQNNLTFLRKAETGWYDFHISGEADIFEKANLFILSQIVEDIEIPKYGKYGVIPDDSSYGDQWYLKQSNGINIDIESAWDITTGDPNIIVAILDSGTDWTQEDLGTGSDSYQNIYTNSGEDTWSDSNNPSTGNGIDDDGNGLIDDWKGWDFSNNNNDSRGPYYHGTHVAGIVGAKTNNGNGISGIAGGWNDEGIKMLICGVGDSAPNSSILDDGILYAAQMGVKVIQLSLTVVQSQAIDDALEMAYNDYGVTVVCASGNGSNPNSVAYPSSSQYTLSVGASTETDSRASFSNHGYNLFISAPGTNILSTRLNNQYGSGSGTSYAAPIISGTVGLMLSVNPCLTNLQIKEILKTNSRKGWWL